MGTSDDAERRRQISYLQTAVFGTARHRRWLDWLKRRLWAVSESGVFGWLGDRADDLEHFSHGVAAWRYRRKHRR